MAVRRLIDRLQGGSISSGSLLSFGLRVGQMAVTLLTTLLLARAMGSEQFGAYAFAIGWLAVVSGVFNCGFRNSLVRDISKAFATESYDDVRSMLLTANVVCLLVVSVGLAVLIAFGELFLPQDDPLLAQTVSLALLATPVLVLTQIRQAVLRGMRKLASFLLPDLVVQPLVLLLLVVGLLVLSDGPLVAHSVVYCYGIAAAVAFLTGTLLLARALPTAVRRARSRVDLIWLRNALPFLVIIGTTSLNGHLDVLMVGYHLGPEATGVYAFAARLALIVTFAVSALLVPLGPAFADCYARGDLSELERKVKLGAAAGAVGTAAIVAGLLAIAPLLMQWGGADYEKGYLAMAILAGGRLVEALIGPAAGVLAMTAYARTTAIALTVGAVANLVLNLLLIPRLAIEGAALATSLSIVLQALVLAIVLRRTLGISSWAAGGIKPLLRHLLRG